MTKENYTSMSNEELLLEVRKIKTSINHLGRKIKSCNNGLFEEILSRTSFLVDTAIPFTARLYCLEHNLTEQPKCKMCNNHVEWYGKINCFRTYCSRDCQYSDEDLWKKIHVTCMDRLGVENPFQSKLVQEQIKNKHRENLGVDYPMQSRIVREKSIMSCRKNMGVDNPSQSEEVKCKKSETTFAHFGVENPFQSPIVRDKCIATCLKEFGVDNFSKSPLFSAFHRKRIFHDERWFDSTWEVKVYDFLKDNGIPFEHSPSMSIPYGYDGKTYFYHPDFVVNNKFYEVKGDQFFRVNESTGREEMYCAWRNPEWTDEHYAWVCAKYEAKHQCMLAHGVTILRESDIDNLSLRTFVPLV